jgi:hypothetical protein
MCFLKRTIFTCGHSTVDSNICGDEQKRLQRAQLGNSRERMERAKACKNHVFEERTVSAESCLSCVYLTRWDGLGQQLSRQLEQCQEPRCRLYAGHSEVIDELCDFEDCDIPEGHACFHRFHAEPQQETEPKLSDAAKIGQNLQMLNLMVLSAMGPFFQQWYQLDLVGSTNRIDVSTSKPPPETKPPLAAQGPVTRSLGESSLIFDIRRLETNNNYSRLRPSERDIRLFELLPQSKDNKIRGSFIYTHLSACPAYTALSYTWGEAKDLQTVHLPGSKTINVRSNLWSFLSQQAKTIESPRLFWIDAICIDQENVHERNHQVNLMNEIYMNAINMWIWLGIEGEDSDRAMEFIQEKGSRGLRSKGVGYWPLWTKDEGKALCELLERPYWRRMWIIQEVAHAQKIIVGCGSRSFEWEHFETFYLTLKKIEDTSWFAHHQNAIKIFQSSACTMAWQRAYWRHSMTPAPALQELIELFQDWRCTDVRDKVYALVNMASPVTRIKPDYTLSARDVYFAVQIIHPNAKPHFFNLLSQILGVPGRDVNFHDPSL